MVAAVKWQWGQGLMHTDAVTVMQSRFKMENNDPPLSSAKQRIEQGVKCENKDQGVHI
jgi:hypothetical protein